MNFPPSLIEKLRAARHIVIFTGAGVSAESGIPTFRDALTGLWQRFDVAALDTRQAFRADPELVWGWYEWRRGKVMRAQPNPAHCAIAAMARQLPALTVITQNVDDLHERAGSVEPIHLHGSLLRPRCFACNRPYSLGSELPDEPEGGRRLAPPKCLHCGGQVRPGVVWFGEELPPDAWRKAREAVGRCDVIFSIGTSFLVYPAAELPLLAAARGALVIQVNPGTTPLDKGARYNLVGPAGVVMPALYAAVWPEGQLGSLEVPPEVFRP